MWIIRKRIKHFFLRLANTGLNEQIPEEDARLILIHNYLGLASAILLSPFPLLFLFLDLYEGLYLCAISFLALVVPFALNYFQYFALARFLGLTLGMLGFIMGVVFYGYNAGFQFGIMALLVLPILYFQKIYQKIGAIAINLVFCVGVLIGFHPYIPFYSAGETVFFLQIFLLFFCTLLVISYFIGLDWINHLYRIRNAELVEKLTVRNEELKNFSYSTSHDLKQPLQTILSFVALFRKKKENHLDEEGKIYLNFILEAGTRLNHLIDALLAHSVLGQKEKFEPTNCSELVQNVRLDLENLIQQNNGRLFIAPLPTVVANKEELSSVFQNLITNAIKFKKEDSHPIVRIGAEDQGQHWKFYVQDNGTGIDQHLKDKIFQMFQKGHTNSSINGSGIGLANCKKIINLHGGDIWVESEAGKGSSFYFTLKKLKPTV